MKSTKTSKNNKIDKSINEKYKNSKKSDKNLYKS